jgi:hypothetical protein
MASAQGFFGAEKVTKAEFTSKGLALSVTEDFKQLIRLNGLLEAAIGVM